MLIGYKASVSNLFKLKNKTCVFNLVRNVWFWEIEFSALTKWFNYVWAWSQEIKEN